MYLVEMWLKPDDLFRPTPDAEIDDSVADLFFPLGTTPEHQAWITSLISDSYGEDGYPWTRLGYTYDWGSIESEVGASEFVISEGAEVEIKSVNETANYCPQG